MSVRVWRNWMQQPNARSLRNPTRRRQSAHAYCSVCSTIEALLVLWEMCSVPLFSFGTYFAKCSSNEYSGIIVFASKSAVTRPAGIVYLSIRTASFVCSKSVNVHCKLFGGVYGACVPVHLCICAFARMCVPMCVHASTCPCIYVHLHILKINGTSE